MEIYLTTQPIFDKNIRTYAYQIIHQNQTTSDTDVSSLLMNAFNTVGLHVLTRGNPAFIPFTRTLLEKEIATLFPPAHLGVEISTELFEDKSIRDQLQKLRDSHYTIVLVGPLNKERFDLYVSLVDIIKIDFKHTKLTDKIFYADSLIKKGVELIATGIDDYDDYDYARKIGYGYFQGDFFNKPITTSVKETKPLKMNYLQLLQKVNDDIADFREIAEIISQDVSLTYTFLKLVNSVLFGFKEKIKSINQALVILGEKELKKWISFLALRDIAQDQPDELLRMTLVRAKFLELLSVQTPYKNRSSDMFLTGLFSLLDVLMDRPMPELLEDLPISEDIKQALIHQKGLFSDYHRLVLLYEKAKWDEIEVLTETLGITKNQVIDHYIASLRWCEEIIDQKG